MIKTAVFVCMFILCAPRCPGPLRPAHGIRVENLSAPFITEHTGDRRIILGGKGINADDTGK